MKDYLTAKELALLPLSVNLMTYECGIRFLTDYLNGDTYFKIHREHHNLDRARNQFKLVSDMEKKLPENFVKINQSCIANIDKINRFDASFSGTLKLIFKNSYTDYVSRRQLKTVKERIGI